MPPASATSTTSSSSGDRTGRGSGHCDRTIVDWRLSRSGIAGVAAAALEEALRDRGITDGHDPLMVRSDNGLVFGAKVFVSVVRRYFLTLKQECVWLHRFESRDHAFTVVGQWLARYDRERPHSALGYLTPSEFRERLAA